MSRIATLFLKIILVFCLLISFLSAIHAHDLKGVLLDYKSQEPLTGVNIYIKELNIGTVSNQFGQFKISVTENRKYEVSFSSIGYKSIVREFDFSEKNHKVTIALKVGEINLDELTISSEKNITSNIINQIDLQLRPIANSQEVLRTVPGLFIAQHAGGGKAEQIFLRGFDIDHGTDLALFADGVPVNMVSHAHGQGYADLHFIIPETVDQLNFSKGPYAGNIGNFATAGFVDFKLKKNINENLIKIETGQFNSHRFLGMIKLIDKQSQHFKHSAFIATEYQYSDGYFETPQDFNRTNIYANYHLNYRNKHLIDISASLFNSKWKASGQIPERAVDNSSITRFGFIDNREKGKTGNKRINFNMKSLMNDKISLTNQFYFVNYDFDLYSNFTFFLNSRNEGDLIRQNEKRNVLGYKSNIFIEKNIAGKPSLTEIGIQYRRDIITNNQLSHLGLNNQHLSYLANGDVVENNFSTYISENLEVNSKLSLNTSVRFESFNFSYSDKTRVNNVKNKTSTQIMLPKFSLNYVFNNYLKLYFKYGAGFHSNDTRIILAKSNSNILPKAWGKDLGLEIKPFDHLFIQTAIWQLNSEDELVYVGDEGIVEASGPSVRKGFDLSVRYQINKVLFLDVDFTYSKANYINEPNGSNYVPLAPKTTATGGINVKLKNGFNGSLRYRYLSNRPANEDNSFTAKGYFITDLKASYTYKSFDFGCSVENLFNHNWKEAQFETTSQLKEENVPVSEIHFTPGTPFFAKVFIGFRF